MTIMKKLLLLTVIVLAISACKNKTEVKNNTVAAPKTVTLNPNTSIEKGCYRYSNGGSVVAMEITENENQVAGTLEIAYAEKDASKGTFAGTMNGDKLMATYTFLSEGKVNTREIAYLLKNNQLIEGYAEMDEKGTNFKDTNAIEYTSTMPLSRVDCNQ